MADTETPAQPDQPDQPDEAQDPQDLAPPEQQADPSETVEGNIVDRTENPDYDVDAPASELFDPNDHNIGDVQVALNAADGPEFARIKAAERDGKGRKGVLEYTQNPANVEPSADGYTRVIVDA